MIIIIIIIIIINIIINNNIIIIIIIIIIKKLKLLKRLMHLRTNFDFKWQFNQSDLFWAQSLIINNVKKYMK